MFSFQAVTVTLADPRIVFVIPKLVSVSVASMSWDERAIAATRDTGIWTRSGAARNASAISMEVSMRIATFTRVSVSAS